jgi:hypothetical protein
VNDRLIKSPPYLKKKYAIHKNNNLVKIKTLDDGQRVYEFMRFDNCWQGLSNGDNGSSKKYWRVYDCLHSSGQK